MNGTVCLLKASGKYLFGNEIRDVNNEHVIEARKLWQGMASFLWSKSKRARH